MSSPTQATRELQITTPLGPDVLLLERITGEEGISMPFHYDVEMLSLNNAIDATQLLRKKATVSIMLTDGSQRYINGYFSRFVQLGTTQEGFTSYQGTLVPWLWFLTLWSDCKIFQTKSVKDIVEEVFTGLGYSDFKFTLMKPHLSRDYTVQYRESSFAFVSRLLEEEGIFYYFNHSESQHILTLIDNKVSVQTCPAQATAAVVAAGLSAYEDQDAITGIVFENRVATDKITLKDYNPLDPFASLQSQESGTYTEEVYDYPGRYDTQTLGDTFAGVRLEEQEAPLLSVQGDSTCRAFQAGYKFDLKEHNRRSLNQTYLIVRVVHDMRNPGYHTHAEKFDYRNRFDLIPYSTQYRPPRLTPKGRIYGSHTAVVVGPAGEEIYVDKYGRVKVQFYWDRIGQKNESSSCWIRVSQEWAGKLWGSIHTPRIGQEVIVEFLEGDPDRPIITGRVYNADQMPPYTLPANKTQSGIKTRSSLGGGSDDYNEIRFEDLMGSELLLIHAQKDKQVDVENNRTETVGNDESITIGHDRTELVKNDENITIQGNRTEMVMKDENITIQGNRTETVMKDESITIAQSRTETVGESETITIGESRTETVGESETITIGESRTVTIGESETITIGESQTIIIGESQTIIVGESITMIAGENVFTMGPSGITMVTGAMINIVGSMIMIN
jgi:type VI secretion system secreted protein VgrG